MARRTPTPRYGYIKGLGAFSVPIFTPHGVPRSPMTVGRMAPNKTSSPLAHAGGVRDNDPASLKPDFGLLEAGLPNMGLESVVALFVPQAEHP
jgi:hypothetical protein